jgi:hypothetical protein
MKAIVGIYDAALGARSNETSGRAIGMRQRESDTSTFHWMDNLSRSIRYAGRVLIDLIPAVYDKPRMIRVLGEDGMPKTVAINGMAPEDPTGQVYELARGKYDLIVETGPSYTSKREETNVFLTEIMRANPAVTPLIMDVVAKNLDFPEAEKIAKRFRAMLPPPIQALEQQEGGQAALPEVLMQQIAQLQGQLQQAEGMLKQAEVQKTQLEQIRLQMQQQKDQSSAQMEQQRMVLERDNEAQRTALEKYKADLEAQIKLQIEQMRMEETRRVARRAELQAKSSIDGEMPADDGEDMQDAPDVPTAAESLYAAIQGLHEQQRQTAAALASVVASINQPKRIVRDPTTNKAIGVEPVPPSPEVQ